jgi:hypothetical protein
MKKWKVMAIAALITLVLTLSLHAQMAEDSKPSPESNKSAATQGNFGTEVDDFLDVHNWDGVLGDSTWFVYGGYGGNLQLGYARAFGGIYVSAFYGGNIVEFENPDKSEKFQLTYNSTNGKLDQKTTTTTYGDEFTYTSNNIDILVGFGSMGIKAGFFEEIEAGAPNSDFTKTETIATNTVTYTDERISSESQYGWLLPSIGWGMNLGLGGLTVKPYVDAAIGIGQYYSEEKTKDHTTVNGVTKNEETKFSGYKGNYVNPFFTLGAKVDFSDNFGIDIGYGIGFDVYSNDYDVAGQSGTINGTVAYSNSSQAADNGTATFTNTDTAELTFTEKSAIRHHIAPSLWYANAAGDLEFGLYFELPFDIGTASSIGRYEKTVVTHSGDKNGDPVNRTTQTVVTKQDTATTDTSIFEMWPLFQAGITYPLVRDKLAVNAGVALNLPTLTYWTSTTKPGGFQTTTSREVNGRGEVTSPETVVVDTNSNKADEVTTDTRWSGLSAELSAGFTFSFNRNFSVDLLATAGFGKVPSRKGWSSGSIFDSSGNPMGDVYLETELEKSTYTEEKAPFEFTTSRFSVLFTIKK